MKVDGGEMSETIEEICESLRHSLDDETCEWYENKTADERQWYSDLADRIEAAYKMETVDLERRLKVAEDALMIISECVRSRVAGEVEKEVVK